MRAEGEGKTLLSLYHEVRGEGEAFKLKTKKKKKKTLHPCLNVTKENTMTTKVSESYLIRHLQAFFLGS